MRLVFTPYASVTYSVHRNNFILFIYFRQSNVSDVVTNSMILSHFIMSATCFDSFTVAGTGSDAYLTVDGIGRHSFDLSGSEQGQVGASLCEKKLKNFGYP